MKIALLMDGKLRPSIISDKTLAKLKELGEVSVNETDKTEIETIKQIIKNADIAITSWGNTQMTAEILDCAPNLKLVAHAAGSVKGIVSDELYKRNIKIVSCARVLSHGVSETALGLTISAAKNIFNFNEDIKNGGWVDDYSVITELFDIKIGVVGCGFAGAHYIELLQNFDVDIMAYDPFVPAEKIEKLGAQKVDLETIFRESDIISLHAPSIESTHHMINHSTLGMMKDRVILINTARGSLVDENALVEHMNSGKIKYACLDVTDPEPPLPDSPLRKIPNCIMTPHLAGLANNGKRKIGAYAYKEILRLLQGQPLESEITQDMLATIA